MPRSPPRRTTRPGTSGMWDSICPPTPRHFPLPPSRRRRLRRNWSWSARWSTSSSPRRRSPGTRSRSARRLATVDWRVPIDGLPMRIDDWAVVQRDHRPFSLESEPGIRVLGRSGESSLRPSDQDRPSNPDPSRQGHTKVAIPATGVTLRGEESSRFAACRLAFIRFWPRHVARMCGW